MTSTGETFKNPNPITALEVRIEDAQKNLAKNADILERLRHLNDKLIGQASRTCDSDTKELKPVPIGSIAKLELVINTESSVLQEIQKEIDNLNKLI